MDCKYRGLISLIVIAIIGFMPCILYYSIAPNYHTLTSIDKKYCLQDENYMYLYYDVTMNNHIEVQARCGFMSSCDVNKCDHEYRIGNVYYVSSGYIMPDGFDGMTSFLFVLGMIVASVAGYFIVVNMSCTKTQQDEGEMKSIIIS